MATLRSNVVETLTLIGKQLDENIYPTVDDGGIVLPCDAAVQTQFQGKEKENEQSRKWTRGPSAGSWQGTARREGKAGQSRQAGSAAQVVFSDVHAAYNGEIDAVLAAYPGTKVWHQNNGMWLRCESSLIEGLDRKATFLVAVPFDKRNRVFSWGYWTTPISASWIGPRHTNFPDGTICAFEPKDGTWQIGDPLIKLLDLYSLWAFRHLHLEVFKRWPGYQSVPLVYERINEIRDDEFCGCDKSDQRYGNCCKAQDLAGDRQKQLEEYLSVTTWGVRQPPNWAAEVIMGKRHTPPEIF